MRAREFHSLSFAAETQELAKVFLCFHLIGLRNDNKCFVRAKIYESIAHRFFSPRPFWGRKTSFIHSVNFMSG